MNFTGGTKLLDVNLILTKAEVGQRMKVADLGCGTSGHFVFPTAELVGGDGVVYAVDIQKTVLESVKRRIRLENIKNIKPIWSDIEIFNGTQIEPNSLDVILLINTLYQSKKRPNVIREAVRILKKNALMIVVDWKSMAIPFGPPVEERVRVGLLISGAKKLGLDFEEEFFVGQYHYGLKFRKI